MTQLVCSAFLLLLRFDWYLWRGDFERLYAKVRNCPLQRRSSGADTEEVCHAMDLATIWYPKRALCLQRSAAIVCLLRAHGIPAKLVLGAQKCPFKAHAWVETGGCVVGERSYVSEIYARLDRC